MKYNYESIVKQKILQIKEKYELKDYIQSV